MKLTLIVTNVIIGFTALFLTLGHVDWRSLSGKSAARGHVSRAAPVPHDDPDGGRGDRALALPRAVALLRSLGRCERPRRAVDPALRGDVYVSVATRPASWPASSSSSSPPRHGRNRPRPASRRPAAVSAALSRAAGLRHARSRYGPTGSSSRLRRSTVGAITVYERAGFTAIRIYTHSTNGRRAGSSSRWSCGALARRPALVQLRVDRARRLRRARPARPRAPPALAASTRSVEPKCRRSARRRAGPTPSSVSKIDSRARARAAGGGSRARSGAPRREPAGAAASPAMCGSSRIGSGGAARRSPPRASPARSPPRAAGRSACIAASAAESCPLPPSITTRFGAGAKPSS